MNFPIVVSIPKTSLPKKERIAAAFADIGKKYNVPDARLGKCFEGDAYWI